MTIQTPVRVLSVPASSPDPRKDAVTVLRGDHESIERLFQRYERISPTAHKARRAVVDRMIVALCVHDAVEDAVALPVVDEVAPADAADVDAIREEHHLIALQLEELDVLDPEHDRFGPKVALLMTSVRRLLRTEEAVLFPVLRDRVPPDRLLRLGREAQRVRSAVPTRPRPRRAGTVPGRTVVAALAQTADRVRGALRAGTG
jgi:hypothetical protein